MNKLESRRNALKLLGIIGFSASIPSIFKRYSISEPELTELGNRTPSDYLYINGVNNFNVKDKIVEQFQSNESVIHEGILISKIELALKVLVEHLIR